MIITEPGIYTMPASDYHADPCAVPSLNNSVAKHLVFKSPAHAHAAHPRLGNEATMRYKRSMSLGSAAHSGAENSPNDSPR